MEKKKSKKTMLIFIIAVLAIAITSIAIGTQFIGKKEGEKTIFDSILYSNDPYNSSVNYKLFEPEGLNRTVMEFAQDLPYNPLTNDYRPRWEGCTDEEYKQIFGDLPKFPKDFYKKYAMFMQGMIVDYDRLGEEYWRQPEFYDMDQGVFTDYIDRPFGMWNPGMISCKPTVRQVEMKKGAHVQLSTFFHTMVSGSEAYLGAVFYSYFPKNATNFDGDVVFDQPVDAERYIHTKIISPDNDPIYMLDSFQNSIQGLYTNVNENKRIHIFPPTYQIGEDRGTQYLNGFTAEWCTKVTLDITVDANCPTGTYDIAIDMENPAQAVVQEYNWVISGDPYYGFFLPAIQEWRPTCPFFQIILTII